jgi:hypothetical protein
MRSGYVIDFNKSRGEVAASHWIAFSDLSGTVRDRFQITLVDSGLPRPGPDPKHPRFRESSQRSSPPRDRFVLGELVSAAMWRNAQPLGGRNQLLPLLGAEPFIELACVIPNLPTLWRRPARGGAQPSQDC